MSRSTGALYNLLPAIYRIRDAGLGAPLQNLVGICEQLHGILDQDVADLYENWFIETCADWVVPYIGDLLQSRPLHSGAAALTARSYVANTLSYRRRKGTAVALEQLARDVTNWPALAVEFFQLLATTQYLNHLRPSNVTTPDIRNASPLELLDGPFDETSHMVDVRSIVDAPLDPSFAPGLTDLGPLVRGKYNIPNLGLFLWRLQSYQVTLATPRLVTGGAAERYHFHPLGLDEAVFNQPQTLPSFTSLAAEINVPGPLRRRALYDELEARRQALVDGHTVWQPNTLFAAGAVIADANGNTEKAVNGGTSGATQPSWPTQLGNQIGDGTVLWQLSAKGFSLDGAYFAAEPVLEIFPVSVSAPVPPEQIMICDLSDLPPPSPPGTWRTPPATKNYTPTAGGKPVMLPIQVSVDPVLGRFAFSAGHIPAQPAQVQVSYSYGFSGDMGGGPYNRITSVSSLLANAAPWQVAVTQELPPQPGIIFSDLTSAVAAWNQSNPKPGTLGVIAILDSHSYTETLTGANRIVIPQDTTLLIVAADWPSLRLNGSTQPQTLTPDGVRVHVNGNVEVIGTAPAKSDQGGTLILNGLWIEGSLTVSAGNLGGAQIVHATLVPGKGGLTVANQTDPQFNATLQQSICGPIQLDNLIPALSLTDSIVDGGTGVAINAPGADADIQSSTVFGSIGTAAGFGLRTLEAGNSIFTLLVNVERTQAGCIRFCSVRDDISTTPRRYRCQPDLALAGIIDPVQQAGIRARLTPLFTSTAYGNPGYAQLNSSCADAIRAGADNSSEMGVFYSLQQPQRDANLRTALLEYLRFGLQAGIFYIT
jgi:hypothetical protein